MTKNEFIKDLAAALTRYGVSDAANTIDYYDELIDDHIEGGETEGAVIASLETPNQIAAQLADQFQPTQVQRQKMSPLVLVMLVVLLVLGSPLWGSLLLTAIILLAVGYLLLWIGPLIGGTLAIAGIVGGGVSLIFSCFVALSEGAVVGLMQLGISFAMVGVGILTGGITWYFSKYIVQFSIGLTRWLIRKSQRQSKVVA